MYRVLDDEEQLADKLLQSISPEGSALTDPHDQLDSVTEKAHDARLLKMAKPAKQKPKL